MPNLPPIREYQPLDAYNHVIDNGPIKDIKDNIEVLNAAIENNTEILTESIGTQGTLAQRLAQSIEADGSLKAEAIDAALHGIAEHLDGGGYVRMTVAERAKLDAVASGATDVQIQVETDDDTVLYDAGVVNLRPSDSISWRTDVDGVYADVNFPLTSRHRHYYDLKPVPLVTLSPDYQNYYTTSVHTAYADGSLRVYINGVRISKTDTDPSPPPDVYYPRVDGDEVTWTSISYEEDDGSEAAGVITSGKFALSKAISEDDRITIDFDVILD